MKKWEVKVVPQFKSRSDIQEDLCVLGAEGWELVTVTVDHAYLKREVRITAELPGVPITSQHVVDRPPWDEHTSNDEQPLPPAETTPVARPRKAKK